MRKYRHKSLSPLLKASAYTEGERAFQEGQRRGYNPYASNNLELATIWWNGWDTGEEESHGMNPNSKKPPPPALIPD